MRLVRLTMLARSVAMCGGFVFGCVFLLAQSRDPRELQDARVQSLRSGDRKGAFYTKHWDLSSLPPYRARQNVSGTIRIWGQNFLTDGNLGKYWEAGFRHYHPAVLLEFHMKTALDIIPSLCTGVADLSFGRWLTMNEGLQFRRHFNHEPLQITAATGSLDVGGYGPAFAIIVNKANPLSRLTLHQLDGIFGAERSGGWQGSGFEWTDSVARGPEQNIRTWDQLGLTGEWKGKSINTYSMDLATSHAIYISDHVLKGSMKWNEKLRTYMHYIKDGTLIHAGRQMALDIAKDPYGIGISEIQHSIPDTKPLAIAAQEGGPYVELTLDNVHNRTYPLYDEVFFYLRREPGNPIKPAVEEFLRFVLSREGQEAVQRDGKFLPLLSEVVHNQLKKLKIVS